MAQVWKLTIKNAGASAVPINDLGISIPATTNYVANDGTNTSEFSQVELCTSWDLKDALVATTLVVNDGADDLTVAQALRQLSINNDLSVDEMDALKGANAPDAANPFATMDDISGIGQDTLDSAYDGGGSGAGRTITVDAGAVTLSGLGAGNAALNIAPRTTKSTTLNEGDVEIIKDASGNIDPCVYDGTRTKLLSIKEEKHSFVDGLNTKNRYVFYGNNRSNEAGSPVAQDSTLVRAVVKVQTAVTATLRIRKRSNLTVDVATVSLAAAASAIVGNLDADLTAGDELVIYWDQATGNADYPTISLYTKARY